MNYHEMENIFRQEQLDLGQELRLNSRAIDLSRIKKDWLSVHTAGIVHQVGGLAGYVFVGIALTLAYLHSGDPFLSLPFVFAAIALLLNGYFFPVQKPPTAHLDRYTATELANELADFQRYANRRIPFDCLAGTAFVFAFLTWSVYSTWGINPISDFDRIGPVVRTRSFLLLVAPAAGGLLMNYLSNQKLRKLEDRLRGYLEDELV